LYDLESRINASVFPGHQGGPHNHTITALAVALKQAQSPEFKEYQVQVLKNCKRLAEGFTKLGYKLVSGGTDNHLILVDLKNKGVDGAKVERILELANVALNKNTVPGDKSAMIPGGVRIGTPAVTTRGMKEHDMDKIVHFVDLGVKLAVKVQSSLPEGSRKMKDFQAYLANNSIPELESLKLQVTEFARSFPTIGF
jgi:glycine hydroxymethyltransferase